MRTIWAKERTSSTRRIRSTEVARISQQMDQEFLVIERDLPPIGRPIIKGTKNDDVFIPASEGGANSLDIVLKGVLSDWMSAVPSHASVPQLPISNLFLRFIKDEVDCLLNKIIAIDRIRPEGGLGFNARVARQFLNHDFPNFLVNYVAHMTI